jgi:PAS domain S-box-containing protein
VYRTDLEGEILLANPALAHIVGYDKPEQLVGRNMGNEVYQDPAERAGFVVQCELLAGGAVVEARWKRKDGSPIWVDIHARAVKDAAGRTLYYEGFVYDLTERKHLEEQFRQAQKVETVGRLAGGVAHDFNNLLAIITSYTEFILRDAALVDQHRADLMEVKKATDRATSLTRQLLALGRTQVLRPATITLNDSLTELLPMLRRLFDESIDIKLETAPDLWAVRADPGQIEQVLLNLALNARDAMPKGGALTFVTENCFVAAARAGLHDEITMPGNYVVLRVQDTGVGMDENTRRMIFEPFYTTKAAGKGSGLGLATAYGIVKQSGGYIKVRSTLGKGSEFLIYLPRTDVATVVITPRQRRRDVPANGTVLVVDDEAGVRQMLQRILSEEGYTVVTAASGAEALELFESSSSAIDLLIIDIVMPEMDGRELARQCCDLRDTLKVIYVSGYTKDSLHSQQTFEEGTEFIEKPFNREVILERIAFMMGGERAA